MLSEARPARKADIREVRAYKALSMVEMNACGAIDKAILQVRDNSAPEIQSAKRICRPERSF